MPTSTMDSRSIPSERVGNEYGITNVTSQGRVSITVVPPRQRSSRSRSCTPFDREPGNGLTSQSSRQLTVGSNSYRNADLAAYDRDVNSARGDISSCHSNSSEVSARSLASTEGHARQLSSDSAHAHKSLRELYYWKKLKNEGHEQNELDEILRELLGDTHDAPAAPSRSHGSTGSAGNPYKATHSDGADSYWLQQQQRKLSQRQQSRELEDVTQLHRQQKQLVTELKHVQTRRKESLGDADHNANDILYRTEREVPVTVQEPEAYTVFIRPDELRKAPEEPTRQISSKSLTNVSHTHHTHYNFHDNGDEVFESDMRQTMEEQKRKIMELEDELRKVKMGLEQKPPPRPQRLDLDDDEEDEYLFKPVGIASLESGTGTGKMQRTQIHIATSGSSSNTPVSPADTTTTSIPILAACDTPGQTTLQSHTLQTNSGYSGRTTASPPPNHVQSNAAGRQQRRILEEQRFHHQQFYQHQPSTANSHVGTLPSQSSASQAMSQQSATAQQTASYGLTNNSTSVTPTSRTGSLPRHQDLHINTTGQQANNTGGSGVAYATIASSGSPGRVQFTSDSSMNYQGTDLTQLSAKFVKDTSKYWYKPHISRDEAISLLKNTTPGTFIVRDSNSFPGAFGLAVKVAHLPPNIQVKPTADPAAEYVRFFLIEPTTKGVKLKGCSNEPVFASLASLIYQHTITPMALPCKLLLPDPDQNRLDSSSRGQQSASIVDAVDGLSGMDSPGMTNGSDAMTTSSDLLKRGAACNVVYMNNVDTESLTGPQAISRAVHHTFGKDVLNTTMATFKVSADGITITDNNRTIFFRQHFSKESISYCGNDPADRRFTQALGNAEIEEAKIFGFVAKRKGGNQCLLFAELDPEQPASAIVNFVNKVLLGNKSV